MGFLYPEDVSYTRMIRDMQRHFRVGQQLDGAFVFDTDGEARYSLVAGEDNPWPKLISEFPGGKAFTGEIKSAPEEIGAFVSLAYGINGLIRRSQMRGLSGGWLQPGDLVEAEVRDISQARRQVELGLRRVVQRASVAAASPQPAELEEDWQEYEVGMSFTGTVQRVVRDRGFVLVTLPPGRTGLLNINRMSGAARSNFEQELIEVGAKIGVEIIEVQPGRNRILLRDAGAASC